MAKDLPNSKAIRAGLEATGKPSKWDMGKRYIFEGYNPQEVQLYCVQDAEWQKIRLSMKGIDTYAKLQVLEAWWDKKNEFIAKGTHWPTEVQVGNYLGALRRGGQLNDDNEIRKAR